MCECLLPAKPYPVNDLETILVFAKEAHPEAENDIVALDLYRQDLYKKIKKDFDNGATATSEYDEVAFYGALGLMKTDMVRKLIVNESTYKVKEAVNG
jgi:ribosome recycling factor